MTVLVVVFVPLGIVLGGFAIAAAADRITNGKWRPLRDWFRL